MDRRDRDLLARQELTPDPPPAAVGVGADDNHWCEPGFAEPAVVFKGPPQTARSVTEAWVALYGFCPNGSAYRS